MRKYLLFAIFFLLVTVEVKADSARFYFETNTREAAPGSEITVKLKLSSQNPINAINLVLYYPPEIFKLLTFNDSHSIIDVWKTRQIQEGSDAIYIEGGLTKPFSGIDGEIVEITFKARTEGLARLAGIPEIYLADGLGTRQTLPEQEFEILIDSQAAIIKPETKIDREPPRFEFIQIFWSPAESAYLVVFQAKDSLSGLRAVYLRAMNWLKWTKWAETANPARLSSGVWRYQIKAIDNQGNENKETLYLWRELILKIVYLVLVIFILGGIILLRKCQRLEKS